MRLVLTLQLAACVIAGLWAGTVVDGVVDSSRCRLGFTACKNGSGCVMFSHVCDGEKDCPDGSDEEECATVCSTGQFQCAHGKKCIDKRQVCDGVTECQDRSDETDCFIPEDGCGHRCNKQHCVATLFVCDGEKDCEDGSDELGCDLKSNDEDEEKKTEDVVTEETITPEAPLRCTLGSKLCKDGKECVLFRHVCDGEKDCEDGSDEEECATECEEGQFQCANGKRCIDKNQVCDGESQCQDRSDEADCHNVDEDCEHRCDGGRCLPEFFVCDGEADCKDGSDEANCREESCSNTEFRCASGQCVSTNMRCDGHPDCQDHSDEEDCVERGGCSLDQHRCPASGECLQPGWICDGETDCKDGSDEQNCIVSPVKCGEYQWQCASQTQCVPQSWRCDGMKDCRDESDEAECKPTPCPPHLYQCGSSECLSPSLLCNGKADCLDGSDEGGACSSETCADQSKCAQDCYSTPTGTRCWCRAGYEPVDGAVSCVDVDECAKTAAVCAHTCTNSDGSFQCSCSLGYVLETNGRGCNSTGEPYLLASVQSELYVLGLWSSSMDVLLSSEKPLILSMDCDWQEQKIYWVNVNSEEVKWSTLDKKDRGTLVGGVRAECVAVDWVGRNLYWTDSVDGRISAVGLVGSGSEPVIILDEDVKHPRSLSLLPQKGLMFWSDTGDEARIERAGMDGSDRRVLVRQPLRWPVSLALDALQNRLYWTDEKLGCIGSVTLDGADIKVMHKLLQPSVDNPCVLKGCSHQCVLAPGLKSVCKCPPRLLLDKDGLKCSEPRDTAFLLLLSPSVITQVYLQSRHAGVGLQNWPEHRHLKLADTKTLTAVDMVLRDQALYVWDAGQADMGLFRLKDTVAVRRRTLLGLRNDVLTAMAVDWVTLNVYWSSNRQPGLMLTSTRGAYTTLLLHDGVRNVSSIALHPPGGRLCFVNIAPPSAKALLQCAYMDGQNMSTVWSDAVHPLALSLSNDGEKLYWADASLGVIASVGINSLEYKEIKTEDRVVAFTLANNVPVWVTKKDSAQVWFSDDQQRATMWFKAETDLINMKAFSQLSQQGTNLCSDGNGGCAHLCLAFPGGRTCRCARGYLPVNQTACFPDPLCPADNLPCLRSDTCLSQKHFCDGRPDCPDHSDEICVESESSTIKPRPKSFQRPVLNKNMDLSRSPDSPGEGLDPKPTGLAGPTTLVQDDEAKVEGVDAESCRAKLCSGNGECVLRDGETACECAAGYGGDRCQEQVGDVLRGPVMYATVGLCCAIIVLGTTVGVLQKKKAQRQRQAAAAVSREPSMRDLEKRVEALSAQQNGKDPEKAEDDPGSVD